MSSDTTDMTAHEVEGATPPPRVSSGRPVAIDLFAGAGGFSLGLERAGFDVLSAVEYDPVHAATHAFNFPSTDVLCRDVSDLTRDELLASAELGWALHGRQEDWDGAVDLIVGGPPCQGFSFMGKRLIDDPRNQLVHHFLRLVTEVKPRYFVMENVPGMKSGGHRSILNELIIEFRRMGYEVGEHAILNAADFGVPQDRKRLFLIGSRADVERASYPEPTAQARPKRGGTTNASSSLPLGPSVADAIGDLPDLDKFAELLTSDAVRIPDKVHATSEQSASEYARRLRGASDDPTNFGYPRVWQKTILTSSNRTVHTSTSIERFKGTLPGETEPTSRFYRLHPDGLSNTLRAGTGRERGAYTSPRPIHPSMPRVISVREAARLHSFPDWFRFHVTKWHGFRQIGNAVAPLVGQAVGRAIVEALGATPTAPTKAVVLGEPSLLSLTMESASVVFGSDLGAAPAPRRRSKPLAAAVAE